MVQCPHWWNARAAGTVRMLVTRQRLVGVGYGDVELKLTLDTGTGAQPPAMGSKVAFQRRFQLLQQHQTSAAADLQKHCLRTTITLCEVDQNLWMLV